MTRKKLVYTAFAVFDLLLLAVVAGLFVMRSHQAEVERLAELGVAQLAEPVALSGFQLTDQSGAVFAPPDLRGKWHFVFFGFTSCPDICPLSMAALEAFYRELQARGEDSDVGVIMVSVDPLRDTPEIMGNFVSSYHPDFIGLTGEYPQIAGLAEQLFFAFAGPQEHGGAHGSDDYIVQHSDYIAVVDPQGRYRGIVHAPHNGERLMQAFLSLSTE